MVTSNRRSRSILPVISAALAVVALGSGAAHAQEGPAPSAEAPAPSAPAPTAAPSAPAATDSAALAVPRVHHAPVSSAEAHDDIRIAASFDYPELIRNAGVVYRSPKGELRMVSLLRDESGYAAIIPGKDVLAPGLAYTIELERIDGRRFAAFASRTAMHPVQVMDERMDLRERALYKRLGNRRSVVTATGEYVRFGATTGEFAIPCAAGQSNCPAGQSRIPTVDDQYWRVEAGYTYRPLRTVAEFGIRLGVVRGTSLVELPELDAEKYKVGLNYGAASVRFRLHDAWHIEVNALTSVTEIGFSFGGGSSLLIGDPYGTRLTLGFETIGLRSTYFGSRFWSRLDILVRQWFIVAPVIEVTDMPHAEVFGVRLFGDATFALPRGFGIGVRAGYQARKSTSGGVGLGAAASFAF
jgi:hypothetical protein